MLPRGLLRAADRRRGWPVVDRLLSEKAEAYDYNSPDCPVVHRTVR
jgi:hypothetical protein